MSEQLDQPMPATDKRSLLVYVAVAFGWTWLLWIPALVYSARRGLVLPTLENLGAWRGLEGLDLVFAVAFQLAVYGPLLGAVVALLLTDRGHLHGWMRAFVRFRAPWRWYAFVLLWPPLLGLSVVVVGTFLGGEVPGFVGLPTLPMLGMMILVQLVTSGMEEPGWRGYAWPLMRRSLGFENAGWYVGLIWAAWHVPYVVYLNRAAPIPMIALTLAGFTMSIVAMGYVHGWVFEATGSLPLNITLHAWANVTNTIAMMIQPSPVVPVATAIVTWLFVWWIMRRKKSALVRRRPTDLAHARGQDS